MALEKTFFDGTTLLMYDGERNLRAVKEIEDSQIEINSRLCAWIKLNFVWRMAMNGMTFYFFNTPKKNCTKRVDIKPPNPHDSSTKTA